MQGVVSEVGDQKVGLPQPVTIRVRVISMVVGGAPLAHPSLPPVKGRPEVEEERRRIQGRPSCFGVRGGVVYSAREYEYGPEQGEPW